MPRTCRRRRRPGEPPPRSEGSVRLPPPGALRQVVGGLGFAPKAVISWWSRQPGEGVEDGNRGGGIGFWTAVGGGVATCWASEHGTAPACTRSATGDSALLGLDGNSDIIGMRAEITALDDDGFTVEWRLVPSEPWLFHFLALGGSTLAARAGSLELPQSGGRVAVPLDGLRSDALFLCPGTDSRAATAGMTVGLGATDRRRQVSASYASADGAPAGTVAGVQRHDSLLVVGSEPDRPAVLGRVGRAERDGRRLGSLRRWGPLGSLPRPRGRQMPRRHGRGTGRAGHLPDRTGRLPRGGARPLHLGAPGVGGGQTHWALLDGRGRDADLPVRMYLLGRPQRRCTSNRDTRALVQRPRDRRCRHLDPGDACGCVRSVGRRRGIHARVERR